MKTTKYEQNWKLATLLYLRKNDSIPTNDELKKWTVNLHEILFLCNFYALSFAISIPGYGTDYHFHFPPIPAKSNDLILLKVKKKTGFFSYLPLLDIFAYANTQRTSMISCRYLADQ